jgi:hypothetical protein
MTERRRKFSPQFRAEAVQLVIEIALAVVVPLVTLALTRTRRSTPAG